MNNEISQYFSKSDGSTIATDNDLKSLSTGTVVKNINSKESYKKIAVNVFDKQNDFITDADIGRNYALKSEAVKSINGDGSSTTITYQMADGTNKSFVTKDTTYNAGTGLTLSGTEFSISQDLLDKINDSGSTESWSTFYFNDHSIEVGDVVSGSKLYIDSNIASPVGSGSWRLMWINVNSSRVSGYTEVRYYGKFQKVG